MGAGHKSPYGCLTEFLLRNPDSPVSFATEHWQGRPMRPWAVCMAGKTRQFRHE